MSADNVHDMTSAITGGSHRHGS